MAAIGLLSIGVALTRIGAPRLLGGKQLLYATLAALVLCLPWLARGIIRSGYPLFPSTALAAPVAWRVPKADVSNFYDGIVHLGRRQPYLDLAKVQSGFAWIPDFLRRNWEHEGSIRNATKSGQLVGVAPPDFRLEKRGLPAKARPLAPNDFGPWHSPWSCGFSLPPIPDTLGRSPGFCRSLPHLP